MKIASSALVLALAAGAAMSSPALAQACGNKQQLLKNDSLPAVPSGQSTFAIVPGLCVGEAGMSYFDYGTPCTVHSVSVLYGANGGAGGITAVVDVEIYDGATFSAGGVVTLGPQLYKLSASNQTLQLTSTNLNTFALPNPVKVPSGYPVVGFRIVSTTASGSCAVGYNANLAVDAANTCTAGENILDTTNMGTIDPSVFVVSGPFPIRMCPNFFRGSWVIRACVEPDVSVTWTGNPTPGGVLSFTFHAPGQAGNDYYALMSGGVSTGWTSPWGFIPLDPDPIFDCFIGPCGSALINRLGTIGSNGKGAGGLVIPNLTLLRNSGLKLYAGFVTFKSPNFAPWVSVSAPSKVIVIN